MEKIISIVGLTSSGKSGLGIELAKFFDGEIVSADSRQVYKGLDWCSGKVDEREQAMAKHHLIDVVNLTIQKHDFLINGVLLIDHIFDFIFVHFDLLFNILDLTFQFFFLVFQIVNLFPDLLGGGGAGRHGD